MRRPRISFGRTKKRLAKTCLHRCDDLIFIRELSPPEEPRQQPLAGLTGHDRVADEHVELPERALRDLDLDAELTLQLRGETRRLRVMISGRAEEDTDVAHPGRVAQPPLRGCDRAYGFIS